MTDKMSLEDLYKQETGRTPIAEGCNGCSGYDVDYYDWLENRDAQRESLLAQRTAERGELIEALIQAYDVLVGDGHIDRIIKNVLERATGQSIDEILQEAGK